MIAPCIFATKLAMGRKRLKKDEELPVLFPMEGDGEVPEVQTLSIGAIVRIGAPSNRYYQYIHSSLDFFNHSLKELSAMRSLQGATARVMGMIKLNEGSCYAVIEFEKDQVLSKDRRRLFVDALLAPKNREVIIEKIAN